MAAGAVAAAALQARQVLCAPIQLLCAAGLAGTGVHLAVAERISRTAAAAP